MNDSVLHLRLWTSIDVYGDIWTACDDYCDIWTVYDDYGDIWNACDAYELHVMNTIYMKLDKWKKEKRFAVSISQGSWQTSRVCREYKSWLTTKVSWRGTCEGAFTVSCGSSSWQTFKLRWEPDPRITANALPLLGRVLTVYIRIKLQLDLQADKSLIIVKGPFSPQVWTQGIESVEQMCDAIINLIKPRTLIFKGNLVHLI
jgi:hypothetical protein